MNEQQVLATLKENFGVMLVKELNVPIEMLETMADKGLIVLTNDCDEVNRDARYTLVMIR
jgi:hypothetical protein